MENAYEIMMQDIFLKRKVEQIINKIEENELNIAYKTTQLLINYINMDFLEKAYNIVKLKDSQMLNIIDLLKTREENLYMKNMKINDTFLSISEREVYKEDVLALLSDAEYLCKYKKEKYGI